ncbi:sensor histidine kinase [Streptomyces sp. ST2-7A]|uniref:sensor histidine kinase n=1 Tax=Streptomyces sp. ST2-7A TaxID=2907214 RepID=UPI001F341231|nr:histidine kinase [Streptomyces sp. ST2-7A]MCE7082406.1 histidine kinase [Streptomyces sp. ST2-7A]
MTTRRGTVGRFAPALAVGLCAVLLTVGALEYVWTDSFHGTRGGLVLHTGLIIAGLAAPAPLLGARALAWVGVGAALLSLVTTAGTRPWWNGAAPYGLAELLALTTLLAVVAARGAAPVAFGAVPLMITAVVLRPLTPGVGEIGIILALLSAVVVMVVAGAGLAVRFVAIDRRRRERTVRLEQRADFARDLHDFVAHHVTGMVVLAQGARTIAEKRPEAVLPALRRIEEAGGEALTSMRGMVGILRESGSPAVPVPGAADREGGLRERIEALVSGAVPPDGARIRLTIGEGVAESGREPPVEVVETAHRVVMEALTNARRHARDCRRVEVDLAREEEGLVVRVTDDGRRRHGPGRGAGRGFGLTGLDERVSLIGGTLRAGPEPGAGWTVRAELPLARAAVGR